MAKGTGYLVVRGKNYTPCILQIKPNEGYNKNQKIGLHHHHSFVVQGSQEQVNKELARLKDYTLNPSGGHSIKVIVKQANKEMSPTQAVVEGFTSIAACQGAVVGIDKLSYAASVAVDGVLTVASMIPDSTEKGKKILQHDEMTHLQKFGCFANKLVGRDEEYQVIFTLHAPEAYFQSKIAFDSEETGEVTIGDCLDAIVSKKTDSKKRQQTKVDRLYEQVKEIDKTIAQIKYKPNYEGRLELQRKVAKLEINKLKIIKNEPKLELRLSLEKIKKIRLEFAERAELIKRLRVDIEKDYQCFDQELTEILEGVDSVNGTLSDEVITEQILKLDRILARSKYLSKLEDRQEQNALQVKELSEEISLLWETVEQKKPSLLSQMLSAVTCAINHLSDNDEDKLLRPNQ